MTGFDWPAPTAPSCGEEAVDAKTGKRVRCQLRVEHDGPHHWEEELGLVHLSASWYGNIVGAQTRIGSAEVTNW